MGNTLTLTTPIDLPALVSMRVNRATEIDDTKNTVIIEFEVLGEDGAVFDIKPRLAVTNDRCDTLAVNPHPQSIADILQFGSVTPADHPEVTQAFNQVLGAFIAAKAQGQDSNNAILAKCAELGLLPEGAVS